MQITSTKHLKTDLPKFKNMANQSVSIRHYFYTIFDMLDPIIDDHNLAHRLPYLLSGISWFKSVFGSRKTD